MPAPRPRVLGARPASASTTTLIVAAVILVAAVALALVLGGRGQGERSRAPAAAAPPAPAPAPAAAPPAAQAGPGALPERSTGIADCDELIDIIRCAQPRLAEEQREAILKGGRAILKAIAQVQRLGQQVPEIQGELATACRQGAGQLRTTLAGLPQLAPCLKENR